MVFTMCLTLFLLFIFVANLKLHENGGSAGQEIHSRLEIDKICLFAGADPPLGVEAAAVLPGSPLLGSVAPPAAVLSVVISAVISVL